MKKLFLFFICFVIVNFSCRKADYIVAPQYNNHLAERFLKLPPSSPPEIIRIANKLRELNKLHGFLNFISEKHGFAKWDKAIFAKKPKTIRAGRTTSSSDTIIYIPLVPENIGYVNSFILARLNGSISLELHNRGNYSRYGFYKDESVTNSADKLALQFFILENKVFGKTAFKVIDNKLFSTPLEDTFNIKKYITIEPYINPAAGIETHIYQVCREVSALKCPSQGACCGDAGPGNGSCCKDCWGIKLDCKLVSVVVFTDDGDYDIPLPPPPETGGGGTGTNPDGTNSGGTETSPSTTCSNSPQMEDGLPPCAAELAGWLDGEGPLNGELEPVVNPCDQVKAMVNESENQSYMQKVKDLATPQNLNLGYEKSVALIDGATKDIKETSGSTAFASVPLPDLPNGQKYKSIAHTHPDATGGTYSIFSFGDLQRISELLHIGQLDADEFVAFLPTYKGTYYALTITDKTKLEDFFYYMNNSGTAAQGNQMKWFNSQQNGFNIQKKYFNDDKAPLITETDTNNNNVLDKFLDFMKEADLGVTLFETNVNFDSFTKVEKDQNGTVQRTTCN